MLGVVAVLVLLIGYLAVTAALAARDLRAAQSDAQRLKVALVGNDPAKSQPPLVDLRHHTHSAHRLLSGPVWSTVARLPLIGDDVRAVRLVAAEGDQLAAGPVAGLVGQARGDALSRLLPRDGRVDLAAVDKVQPVLHTAATDFSRSEALLHGVHRDKLTGWVRGPFDSFSAKIDQASVALDAGDRAARLLPTMLGQDGSKTYLLTFGNNAEIRAGGGLPGAWALLEARDGRIKIIKQGTAGDLPLLPRPALPQTPAEREIYGTQIATYFQDTPFTPDFPRSAELTRAIWQQRMGSDLDGVLSLDTVTLSYLLEATGPIQVPGGPALTAQNATAELLNGIYQREPDNAKQDAYFRAVAKKVFDTLTTSTSQPATLLRALARGVEESRVHANFVDSAQQRIIAGTHVAGELSFAASSHPQLGVYLNDATGSKMSYYLRAHTKVTAQRCASNGQLLSASTQFTSTAPRDISTLSESVTGGGNYGTPKGQQLVLVRVYGPEGGKIGDFRFDGKTIPVPVYTDRGRQVAVTVVLLKSQQQTTMTWKTLTGPRQRGSLNFSQTPGITGGGQDTTVPSACK